MRATDGLAHNPAGLSLLRRVIHTRPKLGEPASMSAKKRYQIYHHLIAVCFAIQLVNLSIVLSRWAGWHNFASAGIWTTISKWTYITSWFVLVFLICARFMRDEYAETLWRRAAAQFVYWLVLLPPISMIILGFVGEQIFDSLAQVQAITPTTEKADASLEGANRSQTEFMAFATMIYLATMTVPVLFGGLLIWQRLRDR